MLAPYRGSNLRLAQIKQLFTDNTARRYLVVQQYLATVFAHWSIRTGDRSSINLNLWRKHERSGSDCFDRHLCSRLFTTRQEMSKTWITPSLWLFSDSLWSTDTQIYSVTSLTHLWWCHRRTRSYRLDESHSSHPLCGGPEVKKIAALASVIWSIHTCWSGL